MNNFFTICLDYENNLFVVKKKLFGLITLKKYKYKKIEKAIKKLIEL